MSKSNNDYDLIVTAFTMRLIVESVLTYCSRHFWIDAVGQKMNRLCNNI